MGHQIVLENVRISYPHLFTAREYMGRTTFSATFLMDAGDANDQKIEEVIGQMKAASAHKGKFKPSYYIGEEEYPGDMNHAGKTFIRSSKPVAQGMPIVMKEDNTPMNAMEQSKIYAGCYVNAIVDVYTPKDWPEKICFALVGVQKAGEGDRLDGGVDVDPETLFKPLTAKADKPSFL